jgi:Tol biopolymer transport system component
MPHLKSFDRFVLLILVGIVVLILALLLFGDRVGVQPVLVFPQPGEATSIHGRIGVRFDQPMLPTSVETHFSISPHIEGELSWEDTQTLWFTPSGLLNPETDYAFTIAAGAEAESGRELLQDYSWTIPVRQPDILYLVLQDIGGDLWRYETETGLTYPLTDTAGQVIDFSVDPTGEWIVYAQVNTQGGSDLWQIDREGTETTLIADCHLDQCSQPAWSPDGQWIAYSREEFSGEDSLYQPARVWTLFRPTKETNRLYDNPDAFSHSPSFSPDGKHLATYNTNQNAIRILNLETSQESVIPSVLLGVGDWSSDGKKILYTDLVPSVLEPNVGVYIADLESQQVDHAFGEFIPDTDFSPPRWSPDGEWVAFSARPVGGGISKRIWIINLEGGESLPITNDPTATFSNYRWDPWGNQLVFQRFPISGPFSHASLWLWDRATGETRLLVEDGARPEWLP